MESAGGEAVWRGDSEHRIDMTKGAAGGRHRRRKGDRHTSTIATPFTTESRIIALMLNSRTYQQNRPPTRHSDLDPIAPVWRDSPGWARCRLINRMRLRGSQPGTGRPGAVGVVVIPVLIRLKTGDEPVAGIHVVLRRVLRRRCVATSDVAACRTATQMHPPSGTLARETFHAAGPARRNTRVDVVHRHVNHPRGDSNDSFAASAATWLLLGPSFVG